MTLLWDWTRSYNIEHFVLDISLSAFSMLSVAEPISCTENTSLPTHINAMTPVCSEIGLFTLLSVLSACNPVDSRSDTWTA